MFTSLQTGPLLPAASRLAPGKASDPRRLARRFAGSSLLGALTAPHGVERYLELLLPSFSLREPRGEIVEVRRSTPASVTLRLRPNELWSGFHAGQFVAMAVEIDGARRTRCYSPASSQHATASEFELTVRTHAEGLVSRHLREHAHPGMVVGLAQAAGDFVLPTPRPERLLLISGGSGITPVMSMLRTLCDEGRTAPVSFLHFARRERDVAYRAELDELSRSNPNVRVALLYTREPGAPLRPRLSRKLLRAVEPHHRQADVYVCGPPGLIDATRRLWAQDGHEDRVHSESFLPLRLTAPSAGCGSVSFTRSGVHVAAAGATLLEQAERAGLSPAYGCRRGICHTCTTRKLAGQVRNVNSGELSSYEDEDIQLCVSAPAGDVALDL